jgi:hypothetical protein
MRRAFYTICALFLLFGSTLGQDLIIKGRVIDSLTRKPVSFASVVSPSQGKGATANVDGNFSLLIRKAGEELSVSSIGYKKLKWKAVNGFNEIVLPPVSANMQAIVIKPNDTQDPFALSIIRKAINNRVNNDPEELSSFSYNAYSKAIVDTLKKEVSKKSMGKVVTPEANKDTGRYQFMVESVFENKYKKPGLFNNKMTAQKVSGLGNPYIIGLVTQIQYFSFYKDDFNVIGSEYHNPISNKYFRSYVFSLVDSIKGSDDKQTYIISFRPRYKSMGLKLLKGQVHIHESDYAIVNVEASAFYSSSISSITFKQNYERVEGKWFPRQLLTQLLFLPEESTDAKQNNDDAALKFYVATYLNGISINPDLKRSAFSNYALVVDEQSGKRSDAYWNERRDKPLDVSEIRTYKYVDSVFKADSNGVRQFERRADVLGYLISGKIPVGNVNIDLKEIVKLNEYETLRLGFGLSTNDRFSEKHKFGVSGGYGFRDRAWKYGTYYEFKPSPDQDFTLGLSYRKDIQLWGMSNLLLTGIRPRNYQYLMVDKADDIQKLELYGKFKMLKKVEAIAFANYQVRDFNHNYGYSVKGSSSVITSNSLYEAGLRLTTRFKQALIKYGSLSLNGFSADDPRLSFEVRFGRSLEDIEGINYVRMEGLYENNIKLGRVGKIRYNLSAGYISGTTPYSMLFSNLGTNRRGFDVFVPATFTTMQRFEFTNTSYAALFTEFETGYIFQKRKKWGISIFMPNSAGIGNYKQDLDHQNVVIKTMNNLYLETGFGLKYTTRKRVIGAAVVYRYGNYAASEFGDNISYRLIFQ